MVDEGICTFLIKDKRCAMFNQIAFMIYNDFQEDQPVLGTSSSH